MYQLEKQIIKEIIISDLQISLPINRLPPLTNLSLIHIFLKKDGIR